MIIEQNISSLIQEFKIPYKNPFCPIDWKDWFHYILYHPATGIRILYNLCFSGIPNVGYISDTFIITGPSGFIKHENGVSSLEESFGYSRNLLWNDGDVVTPFLKCIKSEVTININAQNSLYLRANNPDAHISFYFYGRIGCTPMYVPELKQYGKGFMGWGIIPSYRMQGEIFINHQYINVDKNWYAYHDRNFGRFNWGNIGWTWFVGRISISENERWTYILHQNNRNDLTQIGDPMLIIHKNDRLQKIFLGETIKIDIEWSLDINRPVILPGSMASIFNDRFIRKPSKIYIKAKDIEQEIYLELTTTSFFELIVPDIESKAFTFLKELSGSLVVCNQNGRKDSACKNGFFYAELVH